ncbi:hypothetical protein [Rheinheimera sp.]|uniref:hypothetical protein n=1 Tax=Rheinheimera sp. TaxID=1869214 RepID=UPI003D2BFB3F
MYRSSPSDPTLLTPALADLILRGDDKAVKPSGKKRKRENIKRTGLLLSEKTGGAKKTKIQPIAEQCCIR